MFDKSAFFALVLALTACLTAPAKSFAQDAGVSGIRGPGSAGGLNNSVNDPSGVGNAARIPPPPPNITVPVVPSAAPPVSARRSPLVTPRARISRRAATSSRREVRRPAARAAVRERNRPRDSKFSICRGC
jgi:hypothetical protein